MADNNNGYWPADNGGQPEQPQNDNLQQHAPTTSDAQDQQFAQEPLGAPQEAPAQNDDAQQPQPEAQDTRPTQPLAPVAPTSEQAQASEPTQPLQPQPTQPLYRPAPEYGAYGPVPTQPTQPVQAQPTQPIQQQNPVRIGFIPVLTSLIIFVFRPIADIAMMIRNLLSSFNGAVTPAGR